MDELQDFTIPEILDDGLFNPEAVEIERKWNLLIDQIMEGNVIPVIGQGILLDNGENLQQALIGTIAKMCRIDTNPQSFSQLVYDDKFLSVFKNRDNIYGALSQFFSKKSFAPSSLLKRILAIRQFPFVITTTFDPVVETAMKEAWQDRRIKTLVFRNDPKSNGDIEKKEDICNPTVYYMFGKADTNNPHRFAVTDYDMLSFCKSWMTDGYRPKMLSQVLSDKYLLVLGGSYPDWLFRFIWFSMKTSLDRDTSGMLADNNAEDSLIDFLNRANIFTQNSPEDVVAEIEKRLAERLADYHRKKFDCPQNNMDVFISYSRSNLKEAEALYRALTNRGLNVWFDKNNLPIGANFMEHIRTAISTCRFFVALLSDNIAHEAKEFHVYRQEWDYAIERASGFGREFIIPVCQRGFDLYDENLKLPPRLKSHNACFYGSDTDFDAIAKDILEKINNL